MALSVDTVKKMLHGIGGTKTNGLEVASALDTASAKVATLEAAFGFSIPAVIVATNVSTTVNFGALLVGDYVVHIPAIAGNANFWTIATAGTLPAAAVVNDLYVVLRAFTPAALVNRTDSL